MSLQVDDQAREGDDLQTRRGYFSSGIESDSHDTWKRGGDRPDLEWKAIGEVWKVGGGGDIDAHLSRGGGEASRKTKIPIEIKCQICSGCCRWLSPCSPIFSSLTPRSTFGSIANDLTFVGPTGHASSREAGRQGTVGRFKYRFVHGTTSGATRHRKPTTGSST